MKIVVAVRPRTFCLENVPGLLEPRFYEVRQGALKALRDAGYSVVGGDGWLNAADFGVPQTRKRVFVLGSSTVPPPIYPSRSGDR